MPQSETDVLQALARKIKEFRRLKGWSQEELAGHSSVNRSYLAEIERGGRNPSVRSLLKIANAFEIPIGNLFGRGVQNSRKRV